MIVLSDACIADWQRLAGLIRVVDRIEGKASHRRVSPSCLSYPLFGVRLRLSLAAHLSVRIDRAAALARRALTSRSVAGCTGLSRDAALFLHLVPGRSGGLSRHRVLILGCRVA